MQNIEEQMKRLEIQEKKLRNRTILVTGLVPLLTIIFSLATNYFTIQKEFGIDRLNFTQDEISNLLKEQDIVDVRKKIKFLIEGDLLENDVRRNEILESLDKNLIDSNESRILFLQGRRYFDVARSSNNEDTTLEYFTKSMKEFLKSLELNPSNQETLAYLGLTYDNIGKMLELQTFIKSAQKAYDDALEIDSTLAWVHYQKASIYNYLKKYDKACMELTKAFDQGFFFADKERYAVQLRKQICDQ